jgi:broad specificity phosphatase PhoE
MPQGLSPQNALHNQYYLLRHGQSTSNVQGIISSNRALAYSTVHGLTELGQSQATDAAPVLWDLIQNHIQSSNVSQPSQSDTQVHKIIFVASPFARAYETAQVCRDALVDWIPQHQQQTASLNAIHNNVVVQVGPHIDVRDELVERYFGRLDGQELFTYAYVWPLDKFNVTHTAFDTESVAAVCSRIRQCILQLEQDYGGSFQAESDKDDNEKGDDEDHDDATATKPTTTTTQYHIVLTSHADVLQITQLYAAGHDNVGEFSSYRFQNGEVRYMTVGSTENLPPPNPLPRPVRGTYIP